MDIVMQLLILYVVSMGVMIGLLVRVMERDRKERESLYNRLMSRDYREYATSKPQSSLKPYVNPIQKSIADAKKSRYDDDEDDDFE